MSNALVLGMSADSQRSGKAAQKRAQAIFVQAKLVEAGLSPEAAKTAVETLWVNAYDEGYHDGTYSDGEQRF